MQQIRVLLLTEFFFIDDFYNSLSMLIVINKNGKKLTKSNKAWEKIVSELLAE